MQYGAMHNIHPTKTAILEKKGYRYLVFSASLYLLYLCHPLYAEPIQPERLQMEPGLSEAMSKQSNLDELDPRLKELEGMPCPGFYVRAADDSIVCVQNTYLYRSVDEGQTWERSEIPEFLAAKVKPRPENALVRTPNGTLVFIFLDANSQQWNWNKEQNRLEGEAVLNTWVARSEDNGRTWQDLHIIQDGYNGAVRDAIVSRDGTIVATLQLFLPDELRHVTVPAFSIDDGLTWETAPPLDVGGRGHHDGSFESTLTELSDGRIWLLMRTTRDFFWQSFSMDDGRTWSKPTPTNIDASSSPGMLQRLGSGSLALVWNRVYPEGQTKVRRVGGQYSEREASWQRQELSLAFSNDDGLSWTEPVVIAKGKVLAYPTLFEPRPGVLWVIVPKAPLYVEVEESTFIQESTQTTWPQVE